MESAAPIEVPVAVPPPPFFKPPSSEPPPPPFPANLPVPSAPPAMPPAARPEPMPVEDHDLISGAEFEEVAPIEAMPAVAPPSFASSDEFSFGAVTPELDLDGLAAAAVEAEPILEAEAIEEGPVVPDAAFANDVLAAIDEIFPSGIESSSLSAAADIDETPAGTQIVVSPLFKNFAVDEMVLVIQGLKLLTFEPRQIILKQGEPGNSLYMLTSGRVRAFIKDPTTGKQRPLADLEEGAFFGEMSILTGKPRTATIVAAERSELLELDRATLDSIVKTHPHVWDVLKEFAELRMQASGS
ncbi:MAG: cyclic nucleotide-binding domain-containing protein, partial [Vicinamibacteria bacterium]|nr:cyclic nucleotide-binding domain-containing protein [Vicinamibacteria bacterium]